MATQTTVTEAHIVAHIDRLRRQRGSSEKHLFQAAGISRNTWTASMQGERSFRSGELIAIANALGDSFVEFVEAAEAAALQESA